MKYSELIQFEPIETVIQLREADSIEDAKRLVETFKISGRMGEILREVVIPQLQFEKPTDNKGLLVVGNYGTGKSHLMALISAVAEHAELVDLLSNKDVAKDAAAIAGRFKVIREEIGSTTMSLREIICSILEDGLDGMGVKYAFPDADDRHENKSAFEEMMAAFQEAYPDQGLILVVDELLDYLRSRKEQEMSLDLSFLREVGEVCKGTRFRFVAGVQESLFDNPRFQFVADTLRRVKDRFEQVRIAREDVAFVVAERLLKKDAKQEALIREHLSQFAPLYGAMNERMEEFVRLFPVHPAYLETFEQIYVAEKREALKTLSKTIGEILDTDVPDDDPGIVSYDSYWEFLRDNPSFRSDPAIGEVIQKSGVLEDRISQAFTRPQYTAAAIRIVHALSVHRLTTGDIYAPLGATAEELRDDLCLMLPVPEKDASFLKTLVETVFKEILRTVSGQFISFNKDNGQYFIDLKKDVDFDALIEKKAETLSDAQLDSHYFDALRRVILEDPDAPQYVAGYRIWEHEVVWGDRKAGRDGYLFFGIPNERSTAQPPRDFYLYFIQPFDPPYFKDEKKADEVFFRLKQAGDEEFASALKLYAGARDLAAMASGGNKKVYEDKAAEHLRALTKWLREHMATAVEVTYQGKARTLLDVVRGKLPSNATVRDYVNTAGALLLAPQFQDRSPDYPIFSILVTKQNRDQAAQEALRWIAGSLKSKQGAAVLDAFELLDDDVLRPRDSRYAKHVLELLSEKSQAQVLNRSELIQAESGVEYWTRFRLEPEFLAVVAAALVHSGDVVVSLAGRKLDAASVDQFAKLPIGELTEFKHLGRPRDLPLGALQELCDLLGVPRGLMTNAARRDDAVAQIQQRVVQLVDRVVLAESQLPGAVFWGKRILSENEQDEWRRKLGALKDFLESLQPFNTAGKLKNFKHEASVVQAQKEGLGLVRQVEDLLSLVQQVSPTTSYLSTAEALLDPEHPWQEVVAAKRNELITKIGSPKHRADPSFQRELGQCLTELKSEYRDAYLKAHTRARLGANDDKKKAALSKDSRLSQLQKLAGIEILPTQQLRELEDQLFGLKTCFQVSKRDLESDPVCPQCSFRPTEEAGLTHSSGTVLRNLHESIDDLVESWTQTIVTNLEDPTVAGNVELLSDVAGRSELQAFIKENALPATVSPSLVQALQQVFSGLQKVVVTTSGLSTALAQGGLPCTTAELRERFERHVAALTKGKDVSKVRVVLE